MPNPIPIKTIQFQNLSFDNREAFLGFIKINVIEFALNRQYLFLAMDCNAEHFHKDKHGNTNTQILIHCLTLNNMLTLRAYTQKGIDSLEMWYKLFEKEHPQHCLDTIISLEQFEYRLLEQPLVYSSTNWVPFNDIVSKEDGFVIDKTQKAENDAFQKRLFENLLYGFIQDVLGINDKSIKVAPKLIKISKKYKSVLALKTTVGNQKQEVKNHVFQATFTCNVQLPSYFSLGQHVGYGLGVFERDEK